MVVNDSKFFNFVAAGTGFYTRRGREGKRTLSTPVPLSRLLPLQPDDAHLPALEHLVAEHLAAAWTGGKFAHAACPG